ncbi:hypothetical protein DQ04_00571160 [Trypanosoma grayi]|uniref:hypothetical protein n=1 Tax=Trypanosoma grayi TaxID=71804 RepID=UPI0004F415BB|nr:hypothetical protein DQ04_00571160 [Trypanosoma grayi]KEG14221.1 hypothetical protein DQ04_00571160 [Trypanosoma grayi]
MVLTTRKEWCSPVSKGPDSFPWDINRLEDAIMQGTAPRATAKKQLWCAKIIRRCVDGANLEERAELRRNRQLLPTLRYLLVQSVPLTLSGARLRQHVFSVYLRLLGEDTMFDERVVMDVDTLNELVAALRAEAYPDMSDVAVLLVRRISELPYVSSVLVFEEALFEVLQDLLEAHHTRPRAALHVLHLFVNLCGHPKLHFKLARSRRVVFYAIDTLLRVLNSNVVRRASRKVQRAMDAASPPLNEMEEVPPRRQPSRCSFGRPVHLSRALEHMTATGPSAMVLANLLSFPENRVSMVSLYPDLVAALELCDTQAVSIRLWEVARCATDYLHDNDVVVETQLLVHLTSPTMSSRIIDDASSG